MRQEFKLQDPGEGVHEVEINEVLVSKGDEVEEGDDVLVVESDKAAIELPSPYSGRIVEIRVSEGDTAEVGDVLMVIDDEAESAEPEEKAGAEAEPEEAEEEVAEEEAAEADEAEEEPAKERRPAAKGEREAERAAKDEAEEENKSAGSGEAREGAEEKGPIKAAPAARKLAKEEGVDLSEVEATGSKGHVTLDDVRAAAGEEAGKEEAREEDAAKEEAGEESREEATEPAAEPEMEHDEFGPVERMKLRSIRAATARAMARSWAEIPHVTHEDMADITELERWRREQVKADGDETLTLTPFIAKAAAAVLRRHPRFNARLNAESGEIVLRHYYNLNIAVATERGLMTPVIREVDRKPVRVLAHELAELTERMHKGRASKQDLSGGTFTVTNVGGLGGTSFAPIINPPQTAILGCAKARLMPVVVDGDVEHLDSARTETRLMLPVILAFDHRVLDGADAARFVNELVGLLEDVKAFALNV